MPSLLIFGAGGHGRVVAEAAVLSREWAHVIASDRDASRCAGELIPGVAAVPMTAAKVSGSAVHIAIGSAAHREQEAAALGAQSLATVMHPRASVSPHAQLADGCFVAAQAVVAPGAILGRCVIVNHGAVVDHDVVVGDFSHVAPLAALGGGVQVGRRTLIGSGSRVLPGLRIGDDVVVGAGSVVCETLLEAGTYVGAPARRVK